MEGRRCLRSKKTRLLEAISRGPLDEPGGGCPERKSDAPPGTNRTANPRLALRRQTVSLLSKAQKMLDECEGLMGAAGHDNTAYVLKRRKVLAMLSHAAENPDSVMLQECLAPVALFFGCSMTFIKALSNLMEMAHHPAEAVIAVEGTEGHSLCIIHRGSWSVSVKGHEVGVLKNGDVFGELLLLGLQTRWDKTLTALGACNVALLSKKALDACLAAFPEERMQFLKVTLGLQKIINEEHSSTPCNLFSRLPAEVLSELEPLMTYQVAFPSERLKFPTGTGKCLYILLTGVLASTWRGRQVRRYQREVRITVGGTLAKEPPEPQCVGLCDFTQSRELKMTIEAVEPSLVRIVPTILLTGLLARHSSVVAMLEEVTVKSHPSAEDLKGVSLFSECSNEFLSHIADGAEIQVYAAGQSVLGDGADCGCLCILIDGEASVVQDGEEVAVLGRSAVIGELMALGLREGRSASIVAKYRMHVHCIHQGVLAEALVVFPRDRALVLARATQAAEAAGVDTSAQSAIALLCSERAMNEETRMDFHHDVLRAHVIDESAMTLITDLTRVCQERLYFNREVIMTEGHKEPTLFIIVAGEAGVYKASSHVATLGPGSICGEMAMLGVSPFRTSTLRALSTCVMLEVEQSAAVPVIEICPSAQAYFGRLVLKRFAQVLPQLEALPLFTEFSTQFKTFLGVKGDRQVFWPGQTIVEEGVRRGGLIVINTGKAVLQKSGTTIKTMHAGDHFGSNVLLGHPRFRGYLGTLISRGTCHVLRLARGTYLQALEKYPNALNASRTLEEEETTATEEMERMLRRARAKMRIWRCCVAGPLREADSREISLKYFGRWSTLARANVLHREREAQLQSSASHGIDKWVSRREHCKERVRQHLEKVWRTPDALAQPNLDAGTQKQAEGSGDGGGDRDGVVLAMRPGAPGPFEDWPEPTPSRFYSMRLWDVMVDVAKGAIKQVPTPLPPLADGGDASSQDAGHGAVWRSGLVLPVLCARKDAPSPCVPTLSKTCQSLLAAVVPVPSGPLLPPISADRIAD